MKKITLKKLLLLISGLLIIQSSFSQENYLPGFLINHSGDTVKGFIDYRNWEKNPRVIHFKKLMNESASARTPLDILKFGVHDEVYLGAIVDAEISPSATEVLQYDPALQIVIDTTFLQVLIEGDKNLYYNKNSVGNKNFYIGQGSDLELLAFKKYLVNQGGERAIAENKKYIGQLTVYLNDCPTISSKLSNIQYRQKSLEKLFRNYYGCTHSEISFENKIEKIEIEIGALAGATLSQLKFTSDSDANNYLTKVDYGTSVNFTAGLFFDVILPRNQGKWSINNELMFTSYKFEGMYEDFKNENDWTKTHTEIAYSYLKVNNMLRFKYPVSTGFMFVNVGISNGFGLSETNNKRKEKQFYSSYTNDFSSALDDTKMWEMGLLFGVGGKIRQFSLEARYEHGNGMSAYSNMKSPTNRYYILLGYRF